MDIIDKIDKVLEEGTWGLANTRLKVEKLEAIIDGLKAKGFAIVNIEKVQKQVMDLIGDDEAFDDLDAFGEEAKAIRVAKVIEKNWKRLQREFDIAPLVDVSFDEAQ